MENNSFGCEYHSLDEYHSLRSEKSISIIGQNIVSFNRRIDSLLSCFQDNYLPSIFCISETRFTESKKENISGYTPFHIIRDRNRSSGGISFFILPYLNN